MLKCVVAWWWGPEGNGMWGFRVCVQGKEFKGMSMQQCSAGADGCAGACADDHACLLLGSGRKGVRASVRAGSSGKSLMGRKCND